MGMPRELKRIQRLNDRRARLVRQAEQLQVRVQELLDAANALGATAEAALLAYTQTWTPEQRAAAKLIIAPDLHGFVFGEDTNGR